MREIRHVGHAQIGPAGLRRRTRGRYAARGAPEAWAAEQARGASGRRTVALRDGWRVALVNPGGITDPTGAYTDARLPGYDDSGWREIAVPHDCSIEQTPTAQHGTTSGTGFLSGVSAGTAWTSPCRPPSQPLVLRRRHLSARPAW